MNPSDARSAPLAYPFAPVTGPASKSSSLAMRVRSLLLLFGFVQWLLGAPSPGASIAASATAGSDYIRAKDTSGKPVAESYVFAEGKFFSGNTRDGSLERMTFPAVTKILAASLARQNYFPAPNVESADLVIMVHWGTTETYEDPMKELNQQALNDAISNYNASIQASGTADPSSLNMALSDRESAQNSQMTAINRNAVLLGYARSLNKERKQFPPSEAQVTMLQELAEERYFVILFAYDNRTRLKDGKSHPMWITRLSVRSPGNNFTEALPALARVGAEIFGQQRDDLVRVNTSAARGSVKLGELEVIGTANEQAPLQKSK